MPKGTIGHNWDSIREFERALNVVRSLGYGPGNAVYDAINKARGKVLGIMGYRQPRLSTLLFKLAGLSPGEIRLWHDGESGFMTEAVVRPGAAPVIRYVDDKTARDILRGELTHERFMELATPDNYAGE